MRSLLKGPSAPDSAQLAAMGSRNALSPRRATAHMRQTLGHAEVTYPPDHGHCVQVRLRTPFKDSIKAAAVAYAGKAYK